MSEEQLSEFMAFATEAVRGMASYMFDLSSLIEITAIVKPFNIASRRVLEKAGFLPLRRLRLADGADYDYFKLTRGQHRSGRFRGSRSSES